MMLCPLTLARLWKLPPGTMHKVPTTWLEILQEIPTMFCCAALARQWVRPPDTMPRVVEAIGTIAGDCHDVATPYVGRALEATIGHLSSNAADMAKDAA